MLRRQYVPRRISMVHTGRKDKLWGISVQSMTKTLELNSNKRIRTSRKVKLWNKKRN
jgi:hypothetical protein